MSDQSAATPTSRNAPHYFLLFITFRFHLLHLHILAANLEKSISPPRLPISVIPGVSPAGMTSGSQSMAITAWREVFFFFCGSANQQQETDLADVNNKPPSTNLPVLL